MDWIFGRDVVVGLVWFCSYHEMMPLCEFFGEKFCCLPHGGKALAIKAGPVLQRG
jgi:hypothetical protein